jgi:hypothetical protein
MTDEEIKIKMIDIMKKEEIINKNKENNNIKKRILIKIILLNHRVKYKLIKKLTIKKKEVNKIITNLMIN